MDKDKAAAFIEEKRKEKGLTQQQVEKWKTTQKPYRL